MHTPRNLVYYHLQAAAAPDKGFSSIACLTGIDLYIASELCKECLKKPVSGTRR